MKITSIGFTAMTTFCIFVLSSCGGGGSVSSPGVTPSSGRYAVAVAVQNSAPASVCTTGGITVETGIDTNGNGVLDPSEVQNTQYVCNGANGTNGTDGTNGTNGLTALVSITSEPSGTNCSSGGQKISVGLDSNGNGILDASEVTSTNYVCNGTNSTNGFTSLMSIVTEPSGTNCLDGGLKISSGLDSNRNGVLDPGEMTTTNYVCNGAQGSGITWVDVTGTSVQAQSNTGYLADSASLVTITLPAAPAKGDIVRVTGAGIGGWKIAQNAGQSISIQDLGGIGTWIARATVQNWSDVASSSDGTKLVAVVNGGQIYTSADSGVNWTARATSQNWQSVASSSDGTKLAAVVNGGQIYTSTDSGVTWTPTATSQNWQSVASSSDGTKLAAVVNGGQIYMSTDSGATWTPTATTQSWHAITSTSDGTKLAAVVTGGGLYTSLDSGATWTTSGGSVPWWTVVASADGSELVASMDSLTPMSISTDFGVTATASGPSQYWSDVALSSDGSKMVAVAYGGQIYMSTDSGVTWTATATSQNWYGVASSADGTRAVAVVLGGQIYTLSTTTTIGIAGSISGGQYDAIELQYVGNGTFTVLSHEGNLLIQ